MNESDLSFEIVSLAARKGGELVVITVRVSENGEEKELQRFAVTTAQYAELKLKRGPISQRKLNEIERVADVGRAIQKAYEILSYTINSRRMMIQKLRRRGFTKEQAEIAVRELESQNFLNEVEDAKMEAEACLHKLWGRRRIVAHIRSRGYNKTAQQEVEKLLNEVDFEDQCQKLIMMRYGMVPVEKEERQRMYIALSRFGYSLEVIRNTCSKGRTLSDDDFKCFIDYQFEED